MTVDLTTQLIDFIGQELLMRDAEDRLSPDDELLFSGLVDSIAVMRLVEFIESELNCHVPPQDVTVVNFSSVSTLTTYISAQQASGG